jgi:predicted nucleic acid-binding Zn ribbon protein
MQDKQNHDSYYPPTQAMPRIFYWVGADAMDINQGRTYFEIYGEPMPMKNRWKEFTADYLTLSTPQYAELEKALTKKIMGRSEYKEALDALAALPLLRSLATLPADDRSAADLERAVRRLIVDYPLSGRHDARVPSVRLPGDDPLGERQPNHGDVARLYQRLVNQNIRKSRLSVMINKSNQPVVVVSCPDLKTACFVWHSFRGMAVCAHCGRAFPANPLKDQKYCSDKCAAAAYQKRHRERQKEKRIKKGKTGRKTRVRR